MDCIYARVIQDERNGNLFSTAYYLVPLQYVTNVSMGFTEPEMEFQRPSRMLILSPDKPVPKDRMPEARLRARLSEFCVPL
jgi:hypothetical protein